MSICITTTITFVVGVHYGSKSFLSSSVPDLHLHNFVVDVDGFESEINSDRDHIVFVELVISKTKQQ